MKKILALILALTLSLALMMPAAVAYADGPAPAASDAIVQTFREQVFKAALELVSAAVLAIFGWIGVQAKNLYKRYVNTDVKRAVVWDAVQFVEQVYKSIHGKEKLDIAMRKATCILQGMGIPITDTELRTLIESAVKTMNDNFVTVEELPPAAMIDLKE